MRNAKGQFVVGHSEGRGITTRSGFKLSEAHKEKIRQARAKQSPPMPMGYKQKGNKTPDHLIVRMSLQYRLWRTAVFTRDNFTCVECGYRGNKLNADHVQSFARFPELRFELSNGRTMCEPCHRKTPTFGAHAKKGFKKSNLVCV